MSAQGTVSYAPPAAWADDRFWFEQDAWDFNAATGAARGRFLGEVLFVAHGGLLRVTISDPWVEVTATAVVLTVIGGSGHAPGERLAIGVASVAGAVVLAEPGQQAVDLTLTGAGSELLGNVYPPGDQLDPMTFTIPRDLRP